MRLVLTGGRTTRNYVQTVCCSVLTRKEGEARGGEPGRRGPRGGGLRGGEARETIYGRRHSHSYNMTASCSSWWSNKLISPGRGQGAGGTMHIHWRLSAHPCSHTTGNQCFFPAANFSFTPKRSYFPVEGSSVLEAVVAATLVSSFCLPVFFALF